MRRENREVNEARQCTNALNAARCTVRLDGAVSVIRSDVNSGVLVYERTAPSNMRLAKLK